MHIRDASLHPSDEVIPFLMSAVFGKFKEAANVRASMHPCLRRQAVLDKDVSRWILSCELWAELKP
jgi:hypothetical protein